MIVKAAPFGKSMSSPPSHRAAMSSYSLNKTSERDADVGERRVWRCRRDELQQVTGDEVDVTGNGERAGRADVEDDGGDAGTVLLHGDGRSRSSRRGACLGVA